MIVFLRAIAGACSMLPGWIWALMLVGAIGTATVERLQVSHYKAALTAEKLARVTETAQRQAVAIAAEQANRQIEQERVNHGQQIAAAVTAEMGKTAAAVAAVRADNDRLRDTIDAYASRGGGSSNTAAAGNFEQAARTLGHLLATCDGLSADLAGRAEELAAQVRGLQAAYGSLK